VVYIGFQYAAVDNATYGEIGFYAALAAATQSAPLSFKSGSQLVFDNDDEYFTPHTASGLGSSGFPAYFDNTSGATPSGSTINSGKTWSTGNLNSGQSSAAFTLGPPGTYYFGCTYHYTQQNMRDVIVSTQ